MPASLERSSRCVRGNGDEPQATIPRQSRGYSRVSRSKRLASFIWLNRFCKLLVRYEKLERSFVALNHITAAIIAFRKAPMNS